MESNKRYKTAIRPELFSINSFANKIKLFWNRYYRQFSRSFTGVSLDYVRTQAEENEFGEYMRKVGKLSRVEERLNKSSSYDVRAWRTLAEQYNLHHKIHISAGDAEVEHFPGDDSDIHYYDDSDDDHDFEGHIEITLPIFFQTDWENGRLENGRPVTIQFNVTFLSRTLYDFTANDLQHIKRNTIKFFRDHLMKHLVVPPVAAGGKRDKTREQLNLLAMISAELDSIRSFSDWIKNKMKIISFSERSYLGGYIYSDVDNVILEYVLTQAEEDEYKRTGSKLRQRYAARAWRTIKQQIKSNPSKLRVYAPRLPPEDMEDDSEDDTDDVGYIERDDDSEDEYYHREEPTLNIHIRIRAGENTYEWIVRYTLDAGDPKYRKYHLERGLPKRYMKYYRDKALEAFQEYFTSLQQLARKKDRQHFDLVSRKDLRASRMPSELLKNVQDYVQKNEKYLR